MAKKYTITEAAKRLGISRAAVHLAIKKGKLDATWGKTTVEIRVPLSHFMDYVKCTKQQGRKFSQLNEVEWLLRNFRCDDQVAQYESEPLPESDTLWWQIYARD